MLEVVGMEPIHPVARPGSSLAGVLGLVPVMGGVLLALIVLLGIFETGRELSRYLTPNQIGLAILLGGMGMNLARPCRCAWRRR
jgi:hypothetical protein